MALFEVEVRRTSTVYFEVDANTADEAAAQYKNGIECSEFVDDEEVIEVIDYDNRFDGDEDFTDDYEEEVFESDE